MPHRHIGDVRPSVVQLNYACQTSTVEWFYDDIEVGAMELTDTLFADRAEMIAYSQANDPYPIHLDAVAARAAGFDDVIASFGFTVSIYMRLMHRLDIVSFTRGAFGGAVAWDVTFGVAVRPGDAIRMRHTVLEKRLTSSGARGLVTSRNELLTQRDDVAVSIDAKWLVAVATS